MRLLLALSISLFAFSAQALELPAQPTAHVNDYAGVLTAQARAGLEERFTSFEQRTGHQAAVAIFSTIDDVPVEDVATKLYEKWRLGSKKENDGVLLVLSMKEHAVRIEVGYGLEDELPDALAGRIIQRDMVPYLKQDQVATAVLSFEKRLEDLFLDPNGQVQHVSRKQRGMPISSFVVLLVIFIFFMRAFFSFGYPHTIGSGGIYRRRRSSVFWGGWGGGGGFGGFGGGGGGFSGGGGLSGGGGASGRW